MAIIQSGQSTLGNLNINSNYAALVSLESSANAGFATMNSEVDSGSVTGTRLTRAPKVSRDYRIRTGLDTPLFFDYFPGSAINTATWSQTVSTQTITVASGYLVTNAGASVASAAVSRVQTYRFFDILPTYGMRIAAGIQLAYAPQSNNVLEFGFGLASGTTAPTDGVFFRINAVGNFQLVVNYNGTETQSNPITASSVSFSAGVMSQVVIELTDSYASLYVNDILAATVLKPTSQGTMTAADGLPILIRNYNSAATSLAQEMKIANVIVSQLDANIAKSWQVLASGNSGMACQGQTGGTMGTTALLANSSNGTQIATLSNITIVAAQNTGFGGLFSFAAGVTAATDFIVQSFQNPAGTAALPGENLFITGIKISSVNTGAAVATTCTMLQWTLCVGSTAVSLATGEGAGTKSPRRIPLGFQTWPIAAAIGTMPDRGDTQMTFYSPLLINPGEFLILAVKFYIGTATASQVIVTNVTYDGCYQ